MPRSFAGLLASQGTLNFVGKGASGGDIVVVIPSARNIAAGRTRARGRGGRGSRGR